MVDKYDLVYRSRGYDSWREMVREQDGDWVRAEDHEAELAALRAERDLAISIGARRGDELEALRARVADLSMLVKRLAGYAPPAREREALAYLRRHELQGSPLRDDPSAGGG